MAMLLAVGVAMLLDVGVAMLLDVGVAMRLDVGVAMLLDVRVAVLLDEGRGASVMDAVSTVIGVPSFSLVEFTATTLMV